MAQQKSLTQARLKELYSYSPLTGLFTRNTCSHPNYPIGSVAGADGGQGYIRLRVDGKMFKAHRLAWLYEYGVMPDVGIDHKDRDRSNNRIGNLRLCPSNVEGNQNRTVNCNNVTGLAGVTFRDRHPTGKKKFVARITVDKKRITLGNFESKEEASACYLAAKRRYHPFFFEEHGNAADS